MNLISRSFSIFAFFCAALSVSAHPILDLLVRKGTISEDEADDVRRELAELEAPEPSDAPSGDSALGGTGSSPAGTSQGVVADGVGRREERPLPQVVVQPKSKVISELRLRGRIQGQAAYSEGSNDGVADSAGDYGTFELRRARLGVQGRIYDDLSFVLEANVLTDTDLDSATLTWEPDSRLNVTFGKAKTRFGHEDTTSSAAILTIERSRLTHLLSGSKPLGLRLHGEAGVFSYYAGVYNGATDETGRMASDMDSALWNLSAEVALDALIGGDRTLTLRTDYLHAESDSGYYNFEHAVAASAHFGMGPLDLRAEYMWGEDHANATTRGFYLMPSVFLIPDRLQAVVRYESIRADDGVALGHNRYADRVPGLFRSGNAYKGYYAGINYYIHGDNLKLMAGIEHAENEVDRVAGPKGSATTFLSGVRMQF